MTKTGSPFTKKKALTIVFAVAAIILAAILLRYFFADSDKADLSTLDGREAFLNELGWEIDRESEEFRTVIVPEQLEGIMLQYNKMQQAQGYDLSLHLGERCQQYTYKLLNYAETDCAVLVTLYIQDGELVAGDIHTSAANGFMHGLKKNPAK